MSINPSLYQLLKEITAVATQAASSKSLSHRTRIVGFHRWCRSFTPLITSIFFLINVSDFGLGDRAPLQHDSAIGGRTQS